MDAIISKPDTGRIVLTIFSDGGKLFFPESHIPGPSLAEIADDIFTGQFDVFPLMQILEGSAGELLRDVSVEVAELVAAMALEQRRSLPCAASEYLRRHKVYDPSLDIEQQAYADSREWNAYREQVRGDYLAGAR